ncbi:MAG TPA: rhodanese-like domain-containing protein, partial [Pyrinomonadaceae bacterium]|nr:rhodanese-like domain-containing protein [Pyrinomonadaceae bacterium]
EEIKNFDGIVLDVRPNYIYGAAHVPNSINIGLGGQFASWAGTMIPIGTSIAVFADTKEQINEAVTRLARVGHDSVTGFILASNYKGDKRAVEQIAVEQVAQIVKTNGDIQFVDVRRPAERVNGFAVGTVSIPLNRLAEEFERLNPAKPTYVICQSGYRSSIGTSILENAGFKELYNVSGGTATWANAGLEIEKAETAAATS